MAPHKRNSNEAVAPISACHHGAKRPKLLPAMDVCSDYNETSTRSVSPVPALWSSAADAEGTAMSSAHPNRSDGDDDNESETNDEDDAVSDSSDSSSSLSEDSEDAEEERSEQEDDGITNISALKKPEISPRKVLQEADKLHNRLQDILPRLRAANRELAESGIDRNLEEVHDGEDYIEMNLGLGVLEKKKQKHEDDETSSESSSEDEEAKPDVMRKLLGLKRQDLYAGIQVMEEITNPSPI